MASTVLQRLSVFGVLACALALVRCSAPQVKAEAPPQAVRVARVAATTVPVTAEYVAQTAAMQQVDLTARVQGTLDRIYFKNGSLVHQGQVLMQIQQAPYQADVQAADGALQKARADLMHAKSNVADSAAKAKLAQAIAAYHYQKIELARMGPLAAKSAVSQKDYDQTKTQYDIAVADVQAAKANVQDVELTQQTSILSAQGSVSQAEAQLANARLNLGYTTIASPVTGIISFANVDEGNVVGPGKNATLATVSTIDPAKVIFQLSESDYLKVAQRLVALRSRAAPELQLYLSNGSIYPYRGRATSINRAVDPTTGTISVESLFPNPSAFLRPGQFARVRFTISEQRNAIVVPQSAVASYQGTPIAYVVGPGNKIQFRSVQTGSSYRNLMVITSGLKPGEQVVISPSSRLQAGTTVTVLPANGNP